VGIRELGFNVRQEVGMLKTITIISAMVFVLCLLSSPLMGQSSAEAIRLHKEAHALQEKARSNEDLKKAAQKYEEALSIYLKVGNSKNAGLVYNSLGLIYAGSGQYAKAVEYYEKSLGINEEDGGRGG
jgi:tetratricopeptide (TPR) repeat protein